MENKGAIIMLAWPNTPAIQVNSWYEPITKMLGFNKNGYYIAGHSALVLVEPITGELHYFDFGRYHTPAKHGRVRDKNTDPDLSVNIKAKFNLEGDIINLQQVLLALSKNKSFHGKGNLFASINYDVNFKNAYDFAKNQQNKNAIIYGPFAYKGTNCSRFTSRVLRNGVLNFYKKTQTVLPFSLTQTPLGNILIAADKNNFYEIDHSYIQKHSANIFTFLKHWTLPPLKAVPITFGNKLSEKEQFIIENYTTND